MQLNRSMCASIMFGALCACEAGGPYQSTSATTGDENAAQTQATQEAVPLFNSEPVVLSDPSSYYSQEACVNPNIQFVIPVAINDDGNKDFIVHYWCDLPADEWGSDVFTPVPDLLVAYVGNHRGGYKLANTTVFGESFPKLGGASRKYAVGDMNGDGRPDFAFAMNWEDGRNGSPDVVTSVFAKPAVLLSSEDCGYTIHQLGNPDWGHSVDMVDNELGTVDALFTGFAADQDNFQAFRFVDGEFQDVTDLYPDHPYETWGHSFRFFKSDSNAEATLAVASDSADGVVGMSLYSKSNGEWLKADSFWLEVVRQQEWINWNGTPGPVDVVRVGNAELFSAFIDEVKVSNVALDGNPGKLVIAKVSGAGPEGGVIDPDVIYDQNDLVPINLFAFFQVIDEKLVQIDDPIVDPNIEINVNFFDFEDINDDGLPDLVVQAFSANYYNRELGGVPDIYLNSNGVLVRRDTQDFPGLSNRSVGSQGYLDDINQDGFVDLVVFGLAAGEFGDIEIYTANKHID